MRRKMVGVIGGSSASLEVLDVARAVGYELGRRGVSLVCGGMFGVMEAACEGLQRGREASGTSSLAVGVLPGNFADDGNAFLDIAIPTGMGVGRNVIVARTADALIAVDGGSGTLSEAAYGWQFEKMIVAIASTGGCAASIAGKALDSRRDDLVSSAESAEDAVELAISGFE